MIIGLTGFYCSGKSTAEKFLSELPGSLIIDMDKIGHHALKTSVKSLTEVFGTTIVNNEGLVDRKKLGALVFQDKLLLEKLNQIVHPVMISETKNIIAGNQDKLIVISAAILFEMGLDVLCSKIIVVRSSIFHVIFRALQRDNHTLRRIFNILKNQKLSDFINRNTGNDDMYIVNNNGSINSFKKKLYKTLLKAGVINDRL